jgi:hypothetical protein
MTQIKIFHEEQYNDIEFAINEYLFEQAGVIRDENIEIRVEDSNKGKLRIMVITRTD